MNVRNEGGYRMALVPECNHLFARSFFRERAIDLAFVRAQMRLNAGGVGPWLAQGAG